jgi:hypothetical protein
MQYEKLYYNVDAYCSQPTSEDLIRELEHLMMRLQFLNPIYLPMLTESFLRKDFDFASYLSKVMAKTLDKFLSIHLLTLLVLIPHLALCMLCFGNIEMVHLVFFGTSQVSNQLVVQTLQLSSFLVFACVIWYLQEDCSNIRRKLFPQIMLD